MRFFIRSILVILIFVFSTAVVAGGGHKGNCTLLGSWIGYDATGSAWWMSTADGQNASHGTLNLEVPGSRDFFDGAFSVTEMRGSWVRTSGYTYDWTVVGFPYAIVEEEIDEVTKEKAVTMLLAKLSGKDTISEDCDTLLVSEVVMELFGPDADLNEDDPFLTSVFPDHIGHRILINLPEPPPTP